MKKLEEEALVEECLHFNAMLEDERINNGNNVQQASAQSLE